MVPFAERDRPDPVLVHSGLYRVGVLQGYFGAERIDHFSTDRQRDGIQRSEPDQRAFAEDLRHGCSDHVADGMDQP